MIIPWTYGAIDQTPFGMGVWNWSGPLGEAAAIEPGCVHGSEAAVYSVLGSAAVLHSVSVTCAALYAVAGSEETC